MFLAKHIIDIFTDIELYKKLSRALDPLFEELPPFLIVSTESHYNFAHLLFYMNLKKNILSLKVMEQKKKKAKFTIL